MSSLNALQSQRLILRPVTLTDAPEVYRHFNADIIEYMYPAVNKNLQATREVIQGMIKKMDAQQKEVYAILKVESLEFIGLAGLHDLESDRPEIGIWTKKAAHGHHYGREAVQLLMGRAKQLGLKTLIYPVDYRNLASCKIPQSFGGVIVGERETVTTKDDRILFIDTYEINL